MSSVFPNLGKLNQKIVDTMKSRPKDLVKTSGLISWIRVSSAVNGGLVLESIPKTSSFKSIYGTNTQSGRVGIDFSGNDVIVEGRGLRPSPIIESISVENGNSGLSRKAKFSIKCYTLAQAKRISQHFLEPGYTVLVEYGWNVPESVQQKEPNVSACYIASFNSYKVITKKRTESGGTYDGFMGFITGGSYSSGDDETYIVDVELTTLGEMPTYFQIHKTSLNADNDNPRKEEATSDRYPVEEIDDAIENGDNIGKALFKRVYNKLPNEKRTKQVKSLLNDSEKDALGNPWWMDNNFINVDEGTRNTFAKNLTNFNARENITSGDSGATERKPVKVTIPDGMNWISDQSFIRIELAFKILNAYGINTDPTLIENECTGDEKTPSYNFQINMNNTICRGHKYMFSTDITKLFIPNTNHPTFALEELLTATTAVNVSELVDVKNPTTTNANQWQKTSNESDPNEYAFPSIVPLEKKHQDILEDVRIIEAEAHTWGYLRNLYINLDFFIEVISRPNFVAKDCYYEILNGISSACNSIWKFEIAEKPGKVEVPKNGGTFYDVHQMTVVDNSFTGKINIPDEDSIANDSKREYPIFEPNGIYSPFLTSNIVMDIPAVMKNSILGKRSSAKQETSIEEKGVERTHFFATTQDPVINILDSFKAGAVDTTLDPPESPKKPKYEDIVKDNITFFAQKGQLLVTIRDPNTISTDVTIFGFNIKEGESGTISGDRQNILVGAYDDSLLLKKLERQSDSELGERESKINNPSILAIEFNCELHGISGVKIGDCFKVNRLPKNYSSGIFQVTETSHNLSDGMWKTTITAKLRNV